MALIYGNFPWIPEACIEGNESTRNGGQQTIESSSFSLLPRFSIGHEYDVP
jgi:hypothetical protein